MPSMKPQPGESQPAANPAGGGTALPRGVSVVVPCYNGAATLEELVQRLGQELPRCADRYEVILVNDGSPDESWKLISGMSRRYAWVRGINLMRNYGQHNATLCGVRAARYDVTVTLDDDLQNPPEEIPKLLDKLAEGCDLVYGTSQNKTQPFYRHVLSLLIRFAVAVASRQRTIRDISAFRAFRTSLRQAFGDYKSPQLVIDILLGWGTTGIATIPVRHDKRPRGRSNYGFARLANVALLLWTGYTAAPLRFASLLGFAFVVFGLGVLVYVLGIYFVQGSLPGFPFLASTIVIFGGVQLFTLGIIGEYLARMFNRSLDQPIYVVKETLEPGEPAPPDRTAAAAENRRGP
jgi:undecaprenyl-phosphate 4-deoxy-4-formamido-L-arabinose transferase